MMEMEKLYANLGRIDIRMDGLQAELQRLGQARMQLVQHIQAAEQEEQSRQRNSQQVTVKTVDAENLKETLNRPEVKEKIGIDS